MATDFETIASEQFGIIANAHPLPGYSDSNARLEAEDGRSYTLKVSPAGTDPEVLDLQNRVLETLGTVRRLRVPEPIAALSGETIVGLADGSLARVLTWVPGEGFSAVGRPPAAAAAIGRTAGAIVTALANVEHPAADRGIEWDLRHAHDTITQHTPAVGDSRRRAILDEVSLRVDAVDMDELPQQVIHNDLNDDNVLLENGEVVGVIDVGDTGRSIRIGEAAIAATYAMLDQDDPVAVAVALLQGFAEVVAVTDEEAHTLIDLISARLATSVVMSAHHGAANPHHVVSEAAAWDLLERLEAADRSKMATDLATAAATNRRVS